MSFGKITTRLVACVLNHTAYTVMQGGQGGSPGFLWDNEANRAKGLPDIDINEIAGKVHQQIAPFNAIYKER